MKKVNLLDSRVDTETWISIFIMDYGGRLGVVFQLFKKNSGAHLGDEEVQRLHRASQFGDPIRWEF